MASAADAFEAPNLDLAVSDRLWEMREGRSWQIRILKLTAKSAKTVDREVWSSAVFASFRDKARFLETCKAFVRDQHAKDPSICGEWDGADGQIYRIMYAVGKRGILQELVNEDPDDGGNDLKMSEPGFHFILKQVRPDPSVAAAQAAKGLSRREKKKAEHKQKNVSRAEAIVALKKSDVWKPRPIIWRLLMKGSGVGQYIIGQMSVKHAIWKTDPTHKDAWDAQQCLDYSLEQLKKWAASNGDATVHCGLQQDAAEQAKRKVAAGGGGSDSSMSAHLSQPIPNQQARGAHGGRGTEQPQVQAHYGPPQQYGHHAHAQFGHGQYGPPQQYGHAQYGHGQYGPPQQYGQAPPHYGHAQYGHGQYGPPQQYGQAVQHAYYGPHGQAVPQGPHGQHVNTYPWPGNHYAPMAMQPNPPMPPPIVGAPPKSVAPEMKKDGGVGYAPVKGTSAKSAHSRYDPLSLPELGDSSTATTKEKSLPPVPKLQPVPTAQPKAKAKPKASGDWMVDEEGYMLIDSEDDDKTFDFVDTTK